MFSNFEKTKGKKRKINTINLSMNAIQLTKKACASKFLAAFACVVCLCGSYAAYAAVASSEAAEQASQVVASGVIVDAQGEPIVGASVVEKGTTNGVMADVAGKFSLRVKSGATLEISCVGYTTVTVKAGANLQIVLNDDANLLNETVVVGFGAQKKENLTGAVASVNVGKTLEARPISDVGRGLQGAAPGMTVTIGSMDIGTEPKIRIRGQVGSYEGSSAPLILLDNVEIPSLNLVNPEDIESISVLKDAASASIYGSKAAFGVVLITTKKGAATESIHVSYSGNVSFQNVDKRYGQGGVDAIHYRVLAAERGHMTGGISGGFWLASRESWEASKAWMAKYGPNGTNPLDPYAPLTYGRDFWVNSSNQKLGVRIYDPWDYLAREWAPTHQHNLSVSGKTGKTTFNASLGYLGQNGMLKVGTDKYTRYNANVRAATQINKWLNVHAGIMYSRTIKEYPLSVITNDNSATSFYWSNVYRWGPTSAAVPTDEYGQSLRNDAVQIASANTANTTNSYASVNAGTTITPVKNWDINVDYTYSINTKTTFKPGSVPYGVDSWYDVPGTVTDASGLAVMIDNEWNQFNGLGTSIPKLKFNESYYLGNETSSLNYVYRDSYDEQRQTWNINTTYDLNIADAHNLHFMVGFQSVAWQQEGSWSKKTKLLDTNNPQFDLATGTQTVGGGFDWNSIAGFYGRINYNYKERYLLEANIRYDGTSKFPAKLAWKWYPSVSAGWRVSEEPWMQGAKNVLSNLKLRASWGSIGDQSVASSLYIPTIAREDCSWIRNDLKEIGFITPAAVSESLTWQDIQTIDAGIDMRLWNQFGITFDWFQRDTKNMIVGMEGVGKNFGTSAPKGNYGSLRTRGWELALDWGKVWDNGFSLYASASLADAKSTILEYGKATSIDGWYNGKTYGEIWGYKTNGLFTNDDFARDANGELITVLGSDPSSVDKNGKAYPYDHYKYADGKNYPLQDYISGGGAYTKYGPGDVRYCDLNGDGVVNDGTRTIDDHGDLTVIGNTTPRYEYSFRFDFGWKGIDLSLFFQGVGKRNQWSTDKAAIPMSGSDGYMPAAMASDFWYEEFDSNGKVIDSNYNAFYARPTYSSINYACNDRYLLNLAYLRLKNVTLGYTLPQKYSQKVAMEKLRIYVALENFLTFNRLHGLPIDVEGAISGSPAFKTASVGLQITF